MGVDINAAQMLIQSRRAGVSFERLTTLGRQSLYAKRPELVDLLRSRGWNLSAEQQQKLLDPTQHTADEFFAVLGARNIVAVDASDYEGAAIVQDMNQPIADRLAGSASAVFDGGTLEHVFHFPQAIANCMRMVETGGHFLTATMANNFFGHGFYQFSAELFYRVFSAENGFHVNRMVAWEEERGSRFYTVPDPETVRSRVEFVSVKPTYLYVEAVKTSDVPPLLRFPQQSDYVTRWETSDAVTAGPAREAPAGWPFRIRSIVKSIGLSKATAAVPLFLRWREWALRTRRMRNDIRGYFQPLPELEVK